MGMTRREAIWMSGSVLAGMSLGTLTPEKAAAQAPAQAAWPDQLVPATRREGFPVNLPLNADGSAPEHPASEAGDITDPLMWRTKDRSTPEMDYDYKKLKVKVDTRGLAKLTGTLQFSDLAKLPQVSHTFLLQCGVTNPHGTVKWTGVKFSDFAGMLGLDKGVHYARFVASDKMYNDEAMDDLLRPQVMLAWLMNDQPIPPKHGAPLRLIMPFRYGNRSIKAITEMTFATPGLPMPPLPG